MDSRTGLIDFSSGKDLVELYEPRSSTSGPTGTTHYLSQTSGKDLGSIFLLNSNLVASNSTATVGANCGYKLINGTDLGSMFCAKGTVTSLGPYFNSLTINGTSQRADLSNASYYEDKENTGLTLEFWFKTSYNQTNSNPSYIVSKLGQYSVYIKNNKLSFENGIVGSPIQTTNTVNDGSWHHAGIVINPGVANSSSLYYDGVKVNDLTLSYSMKVIPLSIGNTPPYYFNGSISFLRIWNTKKDANFMSTNYNKYLSPASNSDMIGFYPFSESTGTTMANSSSNNSFTFTLSGSPPATFSWVDRPPIIIP